MFQKILNENVYLGPRRGSSGQLLVRCHCLLHKFRVLWKSPHNAGPKKWIWGRDGHLTVPARLRVKIGPQNFVRLRLHHINRFSHQVWGPPLSLINRLEAPGARSRGLWLLPALAGRGVEPHLIPGCGWSGAVLQVQGISRTTFGS